MCERLDGVFGRRVDDLRAQIAELTARGIELLRPNGLDIDAAMWTAPDDTQVAWPRDPGGNTLSLNHH